jgi:TolB-like protein/DNA-binding winged helix-turn-helix (wHTH) protein/Tfp pilus assembly protein PilF
MHFFRAIRCRLCLLAVELRASVTERRTISFSENKVLTSRGIFSELFWNTDMSRRIKHFYEFGPFRVDRAEHTLMRDGQPMPLRPKVFDILLILVENHGHLVEKEELMSSVWAEQFVEEGNLNKNISMLRQALGEGQNGHTFIETVPKRGYRFIAEVREVVGGETTELLIESRATSQVVAEEDSPTGSPETHEYSASVSQVFDTIKDTECEPPLRRAQLQKTLNKGWAGAVNRNRLPILFLAVFLLVAMYLVFIRLKPPSSTPRIGSIVVLPLQNLSGDPAQEYFVDGMTDALIGDLAKIGALRVISRTSAMHYKGTQKSLPEIARELNVDAVVEGTVQRSGDRVRVSAQLIHAASDSHLWAANYERDLGDVLDLQSEVARTIAEEVRINITPAEHRLLVTKRTVSRQAIDNYLQGRYFWNKRTEEDLRKAIEHFESAISEDPNYAQPYAGLADCYNQLGSVMFGVLPPPEARRRAEEAARKALELDSELAEAHAALGYLNHYNLNWAAAGEEFRRAIELNPNYAVAHGQYASYLLCLGRADEGLAEVSRAQELDPLSLSISATRGFMLENARRYEEATDQFRRVIAMDPNHYQAHWYLGHTYAANRQFDEAVVTSEKAVSLSGRAPGALGILGLAYGLSGRRREANKVLNELLELHERRYVTPAALANVYIGLGDKEQAFVWLEKAYQERSYEIAYLKVLPILDPLRSDPRFDELLRRTGLESELR